MCRNSVYFCFGPDEWGFKEENCVEVVGILHKKKSAAAYWMNISDRTKLMREQQMLRLAVMATHQTAELKNCRDILTVQSVHGKKKADTEFRTHTGWNKRGRN